MSYEQLHTQDIRYDTNRVLRCVSVADFDKYEPFDLREYLPEDDALYMLGYFSYNLTRQIGELRQQVFAEARPLPQMQDVAKFMGGLAIRPFGRFSYIDNFDPPNRTDITGEPVTVPGTSSGIHRQAFVIDRNIDDKSERHVFSSLVPAINRDLYVRSLAVHEMVHLAGIPDIVYFIAEQTRRRDANFRLIFSPNTLEKPGKIARGKFFEEGLATLCSYMYIWQKYPDVAKDTRTEMKRSPNGVEVDLPVRHLYYGNAYMYAAWALERLVDFSPNIWNIMHKSRTYGIQPDAVRNAVKHELNRLDPLLFDALDSLKLHDLDQVMLGASMTDLLVKKATGR